MSKAWERVRYVWLHPANCNARVHALGRAVAWQLSKRFRGRPWDVTVYGGMRIRCYPDSQSATLALYTRGWADWHEMHFLADYLRPGDAFLDVGANIGVYSLLAASCVGAGGLVEAIEPVPETVERLRENLGLNSAANVRVHEVAVGAAPGAVRFVIDQGATNRIAEPESTSSQRAIDVPCVTLDELLGDRPFAAAKLDVEGAEPLVLEGAQAMLEGNSPPVWLIEMNGRLRAYGFTEESLASWLADRGYDLAIYHADRHELEFRARPWQRRENVLAVARSAIAGVYARLDGRD